MSITLPSNNCLSHLLATTIIIVHGCSKRVLAILVYRVNFDCLDHVVKRIETINNVGIPGNRLDLRTVPNMQRRSARNHAVTSIGNIFCRHS